MEIGPSHADTEIEPYHTHAVLVEAERNGQETPTLFPLAEALADGSPVAVLLAGGGDAALLQARSAARRGWPLLTLASTGGVAARVASAHESKQAAQDDALRAIVSDGDVRPVSGGDAADVAQRLIWALDRDLVLQEAWRMLATYDRAARRLRRTFGLTQNAILLVGVVATLLALLYGAIGTGFLRWSVLVAPLSAGVLIALAGRRAAGKRWISLRAAAEAVRSEIFRYRTRASAYADDRLPDHDPAQRQELLAARLNKIHDRLMHSEASGGAVPVYDGPLPPRMYGALARDDGLSTLTAEEYLEIRVNGEIGYYEGRIRRLERRRSVMQFLAVAASAAGAVVAAAGAETWVALTSALGTAPLAYLAYLQVDNTIIAYNQTAARLEALVRHWRARPASGRTPQAFIRLVTEAESILTAELGMWVEEMKEALRELHDRHFQENAIKRT
jgi:hypothetical protein